MKLPRALSEILPKLAGCRLSHAGAIEPPRPINLTLSVTNQCNSRCQSCDIWKIYPAEKERLAEELTVDEIERIFESVGQVYFFNVSGGEPFLRKDIVDIVRVACAHLRPAVVHVPTNGLSPRRVAALAEEILAGMRSWGPRGVKLTLKPSFDGVGELHDRVRGIPGNYAKLQETLRLLLALRDRYDNLSVGVGTVISTRNIEHLPEIIAEAQGFGVDTYISEVAEERDEMRNIGSDITPGHHEYGAAVRHFREETLRRIVDAGGLDLLTLGMRHHYYEITRRWLRDRRQIIPCYAGLSNAHISAYGDLWPCAILADSRSLGNLKDVDFDFGRLWHSSRADEIRGGIARGDCDCPLANQSYANMLLSPSAMTRVALTVGRAKLAGLLRRPAVVAAASTGERRRGRGAVGVGLAA